MLSSHRVKSCEDGYDAISGPDAPANRKNELNDAAFACGHLVLTPQL